MRSQQRSKTQNKEKNPHLRVFLVPMGFTTLLAQYPLETQCWRGFYLFFNARFM